MPVLPMHVQYDAKRMSSLYKYHIIYYIFIFGLSVNTRLPVGSPLSPVPFVSCVFDP